MKDSSAIRPGSCLVRTVFWVLDPKTAALVRVGVLAAIGAPEVCLEWGSIHALAVGATEEEITSVLLAIAPVIGLGRVVGAAPGVAGAFGYDIEPRWMTQMVPDGSPGSAGQRRATPRRGRLIKPRPAGLLGLSWADGDGMGSPSPQPSDNLDQVPILEPEIPAGGRQDQPPGSGATSPGTMARCLPGD